jgi:RHS repeat-associated protein
VERFSYDAYGQPTVMDGSFGSRGASSYDWEVRYAGYRWDGESGLYQVRFRYLHPVLGRWVSRDPLGYVDGMSLYQYGRSAPLHWVDPFGGRCNRPQWRPPWVRRYDRDGNELPEFTERYGKNPRQNLLVPLGSALGKAWTLPNTAIGLGLGFAGMPFGGGKPFTGYNAINFPNNPLVALFAGAITFGNVVNYAPGYMPNDFVPSYDHQFTGRMVHLGLHEQGHTKQYEKLGPFFIPGFLIAELFKNQYGVNPFEAEADDYAEDQWCPPDPCPLELDPVLGVPV